MKHLLLLFVLAVALLPAQTEKKQKQARPPATTVSGCLDQADSGDFVLRQKKETQPFITLHGAGFSDDSFAKHLGHQVKVTGRAEGGVMRVTKVEHVADVCTQ
jgi:hypothetical protein